MLPTTTAFALRQLVGIRMKIVRRAASGTFTYQTFRGVIRPPGKMRWSVHGFIELEGHDLVVTPCNGPHPAVLVHIEIAHAIALGRHNVRHELLRLRVEHMQLVVTIRGGPD